MKSAGQDRSLNVGFISTRFQGLDGVSLEAEKWASCIQEFGHKVYWFAGRLDRDPGASMLVPEAFFGHPSAQALTRALFGVQKRSRLITNAVHTQKDFLKDRLYDFLDHFDIDLIIPENALSIPMHVPLGMALTELIAETGIPTIAHHHDFHGKGRDLSPTPARTFSTWLFRRICRPSATSSSARWPRQSWQPGGAWPPA